MQRMSPLLCALILWTSCASDRENGIWKEKKEVHLLGEINVYRARHGKLPPAMATLLFHSLLQFMEENHAFLRRTPFLQMVAIFPDIPQPAVKRRFLERLVEIPLPPAHTNPRRAGWISKESARAIMWAMANYRALPISKREQVRWLIRLHDRFAGSHTSDGDALKLVMKHYLDGLLLGRDDPELEPLVARALSRLVHDGSFTWGYWSDYWGMEFHILESLCALASTDETIRLTVLSAFLYKYLSWNRKKQVLQKGYLKLLRTNFSKGPATKSELTLLSLLALKIQPPYGKKEARRGTWLNTSNKSEQLRMGMEVVNRCTQRLIARWSSPQQPGTAPRKLPKGFDAHKDMPRFAPLLCHIQLITEREHDYRDAQATLQERATYLLRLIAPKEPSEGQPVP